MSEKKQSFLQTKSTNFQSKYSTSISWMDLTNNDNPQLISQRLINSNQNYKKMYMQYLKNNARIKGVIQQEKQQNLRQGIKSFISKSLQVNKQTDQFKEKFNQQHKIKNKKILKLGQKKLTNSAQKIGVTQLQKSQQLKNLFFSQTKKVIELQEQAMLLEYYYKDKNDFVMKNYLKSQGKSRKFDPDRLSDIKYLRNYNKSQKKHKRFQPNQNQLQSLMLKHNLPYFEKIKKTNFFKQQKFENECFKRAQMNYQWKREKNFQHMQQIIKLNRENLLLETASKIESKQTLQKQAKFNKNMRLFLKFAYVQQIKRAFYEYIDQQGAQKLVSFLEDNEFSLKIKKSQLKSMITKIIRHKNEQKIEIYDFIEFIDTINDTNKIQILELIEKKYPQYFIKNQEKIIKKNIDEIKSEDAQEKVSFTLRMIFQSQPEKLILKQFLPIKFIPKILSKIGMTGNEIPRARLFQFLYWNQKRPQGLNYEQFYQSFLMMGVIDNDWRNVYKILQKVKINQLIQS